MDKGLTLKVIYTKYSKQFKWKLYFYVWAERAVLGSAKTALKFKYEIQIGPHIQFNVCGRV